MNFGKRIKSKFDDMYFTNINIEIFIAGNAVEGESILVLLMAKDKVIHSLLVDSFKGHNKENPLYQTLNNYKVDFLDLIVWTHPHDDHTNGMMKILDEFNENIGEIIVPLNLKGDEKIYHSEVKEVFDKIESISKSNIRNKKLAHITDTQADHSIVKNEIIHIVNDDDLIFDIYSVAPMSNIVKNRNIINNYENLNEFSIAFYYTVGDCAILLTGDLENLTLNQLSSNTLRNFILPTFIKIPHHGSKGSDKLIELIKYNVDRENIGVGISATTAFLKCELPNQVVVDNYKGFSDSVYIINPDSQKEDAILHTSIDVLKREIRVVDSVNFINVS